MFAINAAPFNNNSIENFSNNKIENTNRNKTIRKKLGGDFSSVNVPTKTIDYDSELISNSTNNNSYLNNQYKLPVQQSNMSKNNIESIITRLHNKNDDSNEELPDFNPPPPANSSGADRRDERNKTLNNIGSMNENKINNNSSKTDDPVTVEAFNNALQSENNNVNNYFQQYPSTYFSSDLNNNSNNVNNKQLIEKINYMINLLEEQKDEKTGHVTEEIILYSFLGVFIIFIIDSFARAGKYVR